MRALVEYRFLNPDGGQWGAMDPMEFDTHYSGAGHPSRIFTGGEWWVADGRILVEKIDAPFNVEFDGRDNFVFTYRQENPE